MGLDGDVIIACSPCIRWNHDESNNHGSECGHWNASHGRGLIDQSNNQMQLGKPCEKHTHSWPSISTFSRRSHSFNPQSWRSRRSTPRTCPGFSISSHAAACGIHIQQPHSFLDQLTGQQQQHLQGIPGICTH